MVGIISITRLVRTADKFFPYFTSKDLRELIAYKITMETLYEVEDFDHRMVDTMIKVLYKEINQAGIYGFKLPRGMSKIEILRVTKRQFTYRAL